MATFINKLQIQKKAKGQMKCNATKGKNKCGKSISKSLYKFYSSNTYLLTNVANKRVKKYDILQKTLQIEIN